MACVSGLTNGVYSYIDCCGLVQAGASLGESICLDMTSAYAATGVIISTGQTCTQNCNQGNLSYTFAVTGVCSTTTGTVVITPFGGTPPYTIDSIIPGTVSAQTSLNSMTFTGLTGGTYVFRLNDTLGLQNNELYINVLITPCFEAHIINASGTTCGLDNGYLQVTASTSGSPYTIILYKNNVLYDIETTPTLPYDFTGLGDGIYYATVYDYGNSTGNTENAVISASTEVDFGFWKVNTSNCVLTTGKLAVTGLTGTGPYTYLWSNGQTSQIITGLTQGVYSCTVTDSLGCSTTLSDTVGVADPIGLGFLTATQPSCFSSNGTLTFTLTGGTVPFYFSGTSGQVGYTLSNTFSLTGLSSGIYSVLVRDANFCEYIVSGSLSPTNGFSVVGTTVTNSNCNQQNGSIDVTIAGLGGFYTYSLSGQTNGLVYNNTSQNQSYSFNNLSNDTYGLTISASGTNCVYTTTVNVSSNQKFSISSSTTGSTCGQSNGNAIITVGTGYTSPLDYVLSNGNTLIDSPLSAITYNNLPAGSYTITVTDYDGCAVSTGFTINTGGSLSTSLSTTNCTGSDDGTASVVIFAGEPPFTYTWSNGQTGSTATSLSAGTYSVIVTDASGCTNTQYTTVTCLGSNVTSYQLYTLCKNTFTTTSGNQRGLSEMLNEGFIDITSGYTDCVFNSAELTCELTVNGSAFTETFYTATTLNDVPQDTLWQSTIEGILSGISEIDSYEINLLNNTLSITSNCSGDSDPLSDADFSLGLSIVYDVVCNGPVLPTPTATPVPTPVPTPTPTPTPTATSQYSALYTATSFFNSGGGLWPLSGDESGTISYSGAPNEILTMRLTLPNLINFSGGTSINGVNYDEYSANTFTAATNSSGIGTLTLISSATTHTNVYGQKIHYLEMLNSSSGSTIGPPGTGSSFLRWRFTNPIFGSQNLIGSYPISATTSGDACNNITYDTSYRIVSPLNVGSTVYSGTTGSNLVNGNNKWVSVYSPAVPNGLGYYSGFVYTFPKYVIQIDSSGVITNLQTCP